MSASELADEPSFGRYDTLFRIAAGGMAEVYAARARGEAGFSKLVALKRMLPHLCDDERFVTMFMDEGRLVANVSSPNVVSTLDLGRASDESLFLVMELVVGVTLHSLVRNCVVAGSAVPLDVALEVLAQSARGLHDAHEARTPFGAPIGIVHRDVSPQNILVGVDGRVRITDFGVARAMLRRTKTSTGEMKGKLGYFSPEQCSDENLDRRTDLFSLGIVAWETLVGKRLFHSESPLAVLEKVTRMPIPLVSELRPEVPQEVALVVAKALERDRTARFATGAEFEQALRRAMRSSSLEAAHGAGVTAFVRAHGGSQLEKIEKGIKRSLATPQPVPARSARSAQGSEESSGIVSKGARPEPNALMDEAFHGAPTTVKGPSGESSVTGPQEGIHLLHAMPQAPRVPEPPSRTGAILGGATLIGVAIVLGAWLAFRPVPPQQTATPLPPLALPAPIDPVEPAAEPSAPPQAPAATSPEATSPEAPAPSAASARGTRRPVSPRTERAASDSVAESARAQAARAAEDERARAEARREAARAEAPPSMAPAPPSMASAPVETPPTPAPTMRSGAPRLLGLDSFDDDLQ